MLVHAQCVAGASEIQTPGAYSGSITLPGLAPARAQTLLLAAGVVVATHHAGRRVPKTGVRVVTTVIVTHRHFLYPRGAMAELRARLQ